MKLSGLLIWLPSLAVSIFGCRVQWYNDWAVNLDATVLCLTPSNKQNIFIILYYGSQLVFMKSASLS